MSEVRAAKSLGQHFLRDESVIAHMVAEIDPRPGDAIVEIGPGLGALTLPVLMRCQALTAIEFDPRVLDILARKAKPHGDLTLIHDDILNIDLAALPLAKPLRLIGNLPYNLSSPILFHCLAARAAIADMHFMLQKEVVERIVAEPGSKAYGRLGIMIRQQCDAEPLLDIPPQAFDPPPKVDSAVVRLVPLAAPRWPVTDEAAFALLVRTAFGQRRKMIRKSLGQWFDGADFAALDIDPTARAENLGGDDYAALTQRMLEKKHE
ncbi:MAG: 16S rRNA (adenine(1518)-N(6)/adenine(1519)-N(6))-dimethyltransferase RsmA [Cardiobacteriaceae bacterium]|nr:16S rRNA (adenine(1518)-N(6)/adenine(1519)-N(6))-dimethyltransferase RsmA [Cardiobacteriaceae bacterium]